MKKIILLCIASLCFSMTQANAGCSEAYLAASKRKVNYFKDIGELYSFKEYRRYTETTFGAVLTYPIMVAGATIALFTAIPIEQLVANGKSRYQRKMGEFLKDIDRNSSFKRSLYRRIKRKIEVTDDELDRAIKQMEKINYLCAYKSTPTLTQEGRDFLEGHGLRNIYELYTIGREEGLVNDFWNNLSHFSTAVIPSINKKKDNIIKIVEFVKRTN